MGHAAGDQLLLAVAGRLRGCVREADTVARIGGDEFVVMLGAVREGEDACIVAGKIVAALTRPFDEVGPSVRVAPSIGIALHPEHGDDFDALLRIADAAMYDVKRAGGSGFRLAPAAG